MAQVPDTRTRVLVLAPTGRDGGAAADQLGAAGLTAVVCKDVLQLVEALQDGAGAAVVAEEAFRTGLAALTDWVSQQPSWSDFPFVVLTSQRIYAKEDTRRIEVLESLGNISLMERPLSAVSLVSAVKSGLRARKRRIGKRNACGCACMKKAARCTTCPATTRSKSIWTPILREAG